jgi:hypothetical protein
MKVIKDEQSKEKKKGGGRRSETKETCLHALTFKRKAESEGRSDIMLRGS